MKKVLILAYDFPPYISVGGLRPKAWYDYFKEYGIEPIVVTRQWNNKHRNELDYVDSGESNETIIEKTDFGTIIRTSYNPNLSNRLLLKYGAKKFRLIRKIISAYFEFAQFIFPVGPKSGLLTGAENYLKQNQIDCIIATGDPFILFKYASKLSKKYDVPWVADYRDAWSSIFEKQNKPIEQKWNAYFEKKIIPSAKNVCIVSDFVKIKIDQVVALSNLTILPNGYDPIAIEIANQIPQKTDKLRIAFVGSIQPWNPIDIFLESLDEFIEKSKIESIELNFYGTNAENELKSTLKKHYPNLLPFIHFVPKMENSKLLVHLSESNVLLLFNYHSFMGTKIFDYLGLKRKILFCFTNDPQGNLLKAEHFPIEETLEESQQLQAELITKTNAGIVVENAGELADVFNQLHQEYLKKGIITCDSKDIELYSRKIQVEKLANLIKTIC